MTRHRYLQLRRFTPKSLVLVMLGTIFVMIGITGIVEPWTEAQQQMLVMLRELAPRPFWGLLSIAAGCASVLSSLWPTWNDSWGFVALGGLSMWWACAYAAGAAVVGLVALPPMLTWLGMCVLLWAISRLEDPTGTRTEAPHA